MIVCVAIRWLSFDPDVPWIITANHPGRHADALHVADELASRNRSFAVARSSRQSGDQGFLDDTGRFLSREEAAKVALACGQVKELRRAKVERSGWLTSEDVW